MLKLDTIRNNKKKNVRFLKRMRAADSVNIATMMQCTYTAHTECLDRAALLRSDVFPLFARTGQRIEQGGPK